MNEGRLTLVGTPIGNLGDLTPRAVEAFRAADVILAEDTRRTRGLLTHAGIAAANRLRAVHAHNERAATRQLVDDVRRGRRVVYATDAGMPGVSDPGYRLVRAVLDADLTVEVVPGPSAVLTALVLSGLPTEPFVFEGFLPRKGGDRRARVLALADETRTAVLFEAPHRLVDTLAELTDVCGPDRPVALARELTKAFEDVWRGRLGDAVAHLEAVPPRGEYVVVLGGATVRTVDDETLLAAVESALQAGASAKDAAAEVTAALGVPKRRAYEVATRLASERSSRNRPPGSRRRTARS